MQAVALLNMVVEHSSQQVVGGADGMKVPGKVEVNILHGHHLSIAAAGSAALDPENRAEGRFTQRYDDILTDAPQAVRQPDRCGGLSLSGRGRSNRRDKYEPAVFPICLPQQRRVDLCLITAILLQIPLIHMGPAGNLPDGLHDAFLRDLNIGFVCHGLSSFSYFILLQRKYFAAASNMRIS